MISTLKKSSSIIQANSNFQALNPEGNLDVILELACEEAEMDEPCHLQATNPIKAGYGMPLIMPPTRYWLMYLANARYRLKKLKALLEPFSISRYYTYDWAAYERHIESDKHQVDKRNTQKIERENLNFRTRIKRLARKTTYFSKLETMHDTVIGSLTNKLEFGLDIHA